jgi:filamentous hemagglutinin family protein
MHRFFLLSVFFSASVWANPEGHQVVSGSATCVHNDGHLKITTSDRTIIHWKDFSIAHDETTSFHQPFSTSVVLNRVVGDNLSQIFGTLEATGKVFLLNPHGLLIGENAQINTASFIGSTLDLSDHDFLQRKDLLFKGNSDAAIINLGMISAWDGDVILLSKIIQNHGAILSPKGSVALGAGHEILLKPTGQERIFIRPISDPQCSIDSSGHISALQTELKSDGNPYGFAINHSGKMDALSVREKQGRVLLVSEKGSISIAGAISSDGKEVKVFGDQIFLKNQGSLCVESETPATASLQARKDLILEDHFLLNLQNSSLFLNSLENDISLNGTIKVDGDLEIRAARDVHFGSGNQLHHVRVESKAGNLSLAAGRDIWMTASDKRAVQILTQGNQNSISILAGRDATLVGGKESSSRAFIFSKNNLSLVCGQHLTLDSLGQGYSGLGATKDLTVVVDNLFSAAPEIGPGSFFMGMNARMQGETIRVFSAKQSQNSVNGFINLINFTPGVEYVSTAQEKWGVYFYSQFGGNPYTLFYKDVWVSPRVTDLFNVATIEFLQQFKPIILTPRHTSPMIQNAFSQIAEETLEEDERRKRIKGQVASQ